MTPMILLAVTMLAQLSAPLRPARPELAFPEPGIDDASAYLGYATRFFRDAAGNTLQAYLDSRTGRVVHLLADAEDASVGLNARSAGGEPARLRWGAPGAEVGREGRARIFQHRLSAAAPQVTLGGFLLGSMRVERDFQYANGHRAPFGKSFVPRELEGLVTALDRLPEAERLAHLAILRASSTGALRARLRPTISSGRSGVMAVTRIVQPSLDGRDTMTLEVRTDPRIVEAKWLGDSLSLRAVSGATVPLVLRITSTGTPLTPLTRREIFNDEFLRFLERARSAAAAAPAGDPARLRSHWLEREVRGMELLSSREKLMAGLPTYATYFGRDMLVTALTMRPVWRAEMSEFVIASVLRKLGPQGEVSHEEALGGQAEREAAAEYLSLVEAHLAAVRQSRPAEADSLLARASAVLRTHRRTRENYHMIDDEFQLPVLVGRWIDDPRRTAAQKRAFLLDSSDGEPRALRLLRELALVARTTDAYARDPRPANLVSFPARDSARWSSSSWRDSEAGYGGGRYPMDVNAIWVPHALAATARVLAGMESLGIPVEVLGRRDALTGPGSPLGRYVRDTATLRLAVRTWRGATSHFVVRLSPAEVRARVAARVGAMKEAERRHWSGRPASMSVEGESLSFLAVALDAAGAPVPIANTDGATALFLEGTEVAGSAARDAVTGADPLLDVRLFTLPYPVGLLVDRVGPVAANDAYADPSVWAAFERDPYHGPRVVWGREVNLFLLGAANELAAGTTSRRRLELDAAMRQVLTAVGAAGFRSELWSYELKDGVGRPTAVRYGTGSDIQLWSLSDLAVQFALSRRAR